MPAFSFCEYPVRELRADDDTFPFLSDDLAPNEPYTVLVVGALRDELAPHLKDRGACIPLRAVYHSRHLRRLALWRSDERSQRRVTVERLADRIVLHVSSEKPHAPVSGGPRLVLLILRMVASAPWALARGAIHWLHRRRLDRLGSLFGPMRAFQGTGKVVDPVFVGSSGWAVECRELAELGCEFDIVLTGALRDELAHHADEQGAYDWTELDSKDLVSLWPFATNLRAKGHREVAFVRAPEQIVYSVSAWR